MEQKVTNKEIGTCIWFKNVYGYIGYGVYTNNSYEGQIYAHYKNIKKDNLRNPKYRELKPGDIVEFYFNEGYFTNGSQAKNIRIISYAETESKEYSEGQEQGNKGSNEMGREGSFQDSEKSNAKDGEALQEPNELWKRTNQTYGSCVRGNFEYASKIGGREYNSKKKV